MPEGLLIAKGSQEHFLLPRMANRHGLIAGATGTGKTVTLRVIAENLSRTGVPVFMADVKGDLSGMARPGTENPKISERVAKLGLEGFQFACFPAVFWDLYGEQGHPVRTTISDMGPLLMGRLLNLNETQSGVLTMVFKIADDNGMLLLDLKDLRAMLQYVGDNAAQFKTQYGNVSAASVGAIQRGLLGLEEQGGDKFFGEPALDLKDMMHTDPSGRGVINILVADKLINAPKLYATFLLWLLSELFEELPEVGDPEKPKLVFFFDEAHLLFNDAADALVEKIEQVIRLIRSKGVGVYFVTHNPLDVPKVVLGQLGNRVQHALRAFTPRDQKAVRAAAQTFRQNKDIDVESAITELGVGEALVSFLNEKGQPNVVDRALILPPQSQLSPLTPPERDGVVKQSTLFGHYEKVVDRESAYEMLKARASESKTGQAPVQSTDWQAGAEKLLGALSTRAARGIGSQVGREIIRGMLGSIFGSKSEPPRDGRRYGLHTRRTDVGDEPPKGPTTPPKVLRDNEGVTDVNSVREREQTRPSSIAAGSDEKEFKAAVDELNALIGLAQVKDEIQALANFVKVQKMRESYGLPVPPLSLHLVFTGNPGTGKTTVARLLGRVYRALGVLKSGRVIEVDRGGLVAGYIGQTAIKTAEVIQKSLDGVLFIDEAYALVRPDTPNDLGPEAIETLLKAMEDNRDRLVVIVAGYLEPMKKFIEANPGLQSRFNKYIEFPDYTPEELVLIFNRLAAQNSYVLTQDAQEQMRNTVKRERIEAGDKSANARLIRNIFEAAVQHQANRIAQIPSPTKTDLQTIVAGDLVNIDVHG